jgi:hypothetical protein
LPCAERPHAHCCVSICTFVLVKRASASEFVPARPHVHARPICPLTTPVSVSSRNRPAYYSCISIRQHASAYVSIRQQSYADTSAYVCIRQRTCAELVLERMRHRNAHIRQHTSAYVSIRQHTSAYVSIRQHTCPELVLERRRHRNAHECRDLMLAARHRKNGLRYTSAYVSISIRQHAHQCRYLVLAERHCKNGLREHTSAYVSIRQHTSEYVSIRQHRLYTSRPLKRRGML